MTDETTGEWFECVADNDYEICNKYPYPIRRKGSDRIIKESVNDRGYVVCVLNRKMYQKHRIIALQFIPNPNNFPQIDHINHNRADNRIENLRWVSVSENRKNSSSNRGRQYVFHDELPETAEPLEFYNGHEFDELWIDYGTQKLYIRVANKYRELLEQQCRFCVFYYAYDREGKRIQLYHSSLFD